MNYTLDAEAGVFTLTGRNASVRYKPRTLNAFAASFTVTGADAGLAYGRVLKTSQGVFYVKKIIAGLIYSGQATSLRDEMAMSAPAAPEWFVPEMPNHEPTEVLSPEAYINANYSTPDSSGSPNTVKVDFDNYYDKVNKVWNQEVSVPITTQQLVNDQQYIYDQYLVALADWQNDYSHEKMLQWPYHWADYVLARRSA